jgi:glycosyltransferase involved in cell wall biosynthesis
VSLHTERAPEAAPAGPPLRCLHLITDLETGGAEIMLLRLMERMDRSRFQSTVVSLDRTGPIGEAIKRCGVAVHALDMRRPAQRLTGWWHLWQLIRANRPDIIQTWLYHADLLGLIIGRLAGADRIVWNLRRAAPDTADHPFVHGLARLNAVLSRLPDRIVVNSYRGREGHRRLGYPDARMVVVPNGIDLDYFRPDPQRRTELRTQRGIPPDAVVVGTVARWQSIKGYETFFRAAQRAVSANHRLWFALAGRGIETSNAALQKGLADAGILARSTLMGLLDDPRSLYHSCDFYTSTSNAEGFPTVVAEAMACALPCVVTNAGDSAAIVGDTGWIVPPREPEVLSAAWVACAGLEAGRRRERGAAARRRIEQCYRIEDIVRQMEDLYTSVCHSR